LPWSSVGEVLVAWEVVGNTNGKVFLADAVVVVVAAVDEALVNAKSWSD